MDYIHPVLGALLAGGAWAAWLLVLLADKVRGR